MTKRRGSEAERARIIAYNRARDPEVAALVDDVRKYFPGAVLTAVRRKGPAIPAPPKEDGQA